MTMNLENHERRKVLSILNIEMRVLRQEKTKIRGKRINEKNLDKENLKYLEEKRKEHEKKLQEIRTALDRNTCPRNKGWSGKLCLLFEILFR